MVAPVVREARASSPVAGARASSPVAGSSPATRATRTASQVASPAPPRAADPGWTLRWGPQRTAAAPHLVNNTFTRKLTDNHDEIVKVLINSQT